ncbi:MAG: two-component sensor histidine kinase, partial [Rhodospirillales bacterium]|nr:two-component sensor histidine kinase [Rhodospirillales bacterium]
MMNAEPHISLWRRTYARFALWARRVGLARKLALALAAAATSSGFATYLALTSTPLGGADPAKVLSLLLLDSALLLALAILVARHIGWLWRAHRKGGGGSRLHVRLVVLFSAVAVTPAILVAVFSALFFSIGVEAWFNTRVRTALQESRAVARAYLEEHQRILGGDALKMAYDINRDGSLDNPQRLHQMVATQAAIRGLTEAVIFEGHGRLLARSGFSFSLAA